MQINHAYNKIRGKYCCIQQQRNNKMSLPLVLNNSSLVYRNVISKSRPGFSAYSV